MNHRERREQERQSRRAGDAQPPPLVPGQIRMQMTPDPDARDEFVRDAQLVPGALVLEAT